MGFPCRTPGGGAVINTEEHQETLADRAGRAFTHYLDGDPLAMGELVAMLTPLLWHTARALGLDQAAAEDVVQTAWLQLVRSAPTIHDSQSVMQWLLVCTRREGWRASGANRRVVVTDFTEHEAGFGAGFASPADRWDHQGPTQPQPEEQAIAHEASSTLWEAVRHLPPRCVFLLRVIAFADRPDYTSVAKALGMPVGSIGPTRGRCLAKLRDLLARNERWETP